MTEKKTLCECLDQKVIKPSLKKLIGDAAPIEKLNQAAQFVMERIRNKLNGREFNTTYPLDVQTQVDKLIKQATSDENLAQCYIGWCPYW